MEDREDWRRRGWEGRENASFWNRDREEARRDLEREFEPDEWTARSRGGWRAQSGSPSGFYPASWSYGEAERWSIVPRGRFTGRGPKNYQRSNERIREDVCERLAQNPDLDASEIEIRVEEREVTLEGKVEDRHAKRLAEDLAESVAGVKDVHNRLKVEEGFFSNLLGRSEEESRRDEGWRKQIPIASETVAPVDRPGGSTAVSAVADAAITGTDRTPAVSETTPPSSTARPRPRH